MAQSASITPNLWFPGNAAEAAEFYVTSFGSASELIETAHYPDTDLPEFQQHLAGKLLTAELSLRGYSLTLMNAGQESFSPNPSISFMLNFDPLNYPDSTAARQDLDELWVKLADGGEILMPLDRYPFSKHYGWVQDRYGFSWQLLLTDPAGDPRPFIMPAFMFGGPNQNRAAEAVDHWTQTFPDSTIGQRVYYPEPVGPATDGSVMFSDFQLTQQWFVAMDAGVDQDFTFNEAVSLAVACADQSTIDRYWRELSAVEEAEVCGWCQDQFGVSWQIVPDNIAELLQRPNAHQRMMNMKKLIIEDF